MTTKKQPIEYAWYLPSNKRGDATRLGTGEVEIPPEIDYLVHVAKTAEASGLTNMLIPCNTSCSDGWLLASAIARETRSIKFCVAIRPGLTTPTFAVQQANTLDFISGGRLTVNVVPGGSSVDARRYGDWADHDGRYERADEFLDIVRAFWADEDARVNYEGAHYQVEDGFVFPGPARRGGPPLYFGGSSPAAKKVIAKHADVFLKWGEPPWQIAEEFEEVKKMAREEHGRDLKLGVRFHILVREDDAQAKEEAESIIAGTASYGESSSVTGEIAGQVESVSQQRMNAMTAEGKLWHGPALFSGINLVRQGAGTMLVGSPEVVADAMREYIDLGATTFILSGWPHDEEARNFGKYLLPLLPDAV